MVISDIDTVLVPVLILLYKGESLPLGASNSGFVGMAMYWTGCSDGLSGVLIAGNLKIDNYRKIAKFVNS